MSSYREFQTPAGWCECHRASTYLTQSMGMVWTPYLPNASRALFLLGSPSRSTVQTARTTGEDSLRSVTSRTTTTTNALSTDRLTKAHNSRQVPNMPSISDLDPGYLSYKMNRRIHKIDSGSNDILSPNVVRTGTTLL